jgi:hypothetical protein
MKDTDTLVNLRSDSLEKGKHLRGTHEQLAEQIANLRFERTLELDSFTSFVF